jgi:hypothetical protein
LACDVININVILDASKKKLIPLHLLTHTNMKD